MRASIFFLFLCFLLIKLGGPVPAHAASFTQGLAQPHLAHLVTESDKDRAMLAATEPDEQNLSLVSDDAEDEDANDPFARKFKFLSRDYSELAYQPAFGCTINRSKAAPSFLGRVSYKYLLQRVLRV